MEKRQIVIIDDEEHILELMKYNLEANGFVTETFTSVEEARPYLRENGADVILLDIMLPGIDGISALQQFRSDVNTRNIPIILVSAKSEELDKILGLELGADDYITKPFSVEVLISKINALLRRSYDYVSSDSLVYYNDTVLDIERCIFRYKDNEIELTKNEIKILSLLIKNKGKVVSRDKIMMSLWDDDEFVNDNTLTVNITRLRSKLKDIGVEDFIKTKKGLGYMV